MSLPQKPQVSAVLGGAVHEPSQTATITDYTGVKLAEVERYPDIAVHSNMESNKSAGDALDELQIHDHLRIMKTAGEYFTTKNIGPGNASPDEYAEHVTRVTGLPIATVYDAIELIGDALASMGTALRAQTPDGDLAAYDARSYTSPVGNTIDWVLRGKNIGMLAPSNHPAVIVLGLIAYGTKVPMAVRPSDGDPFTSARIVDALYAAGAPTDSLYLLPGSRPVGEKILRHSDLGIAFGSNRLKQKYEHDPHVHVYGPGNSKVFIDDGWEEDETVLDLVKDGQMRDGGTGCINTSQVVTTADPTVVAEALAERVATVELLDPLERDARIPVSPDTETFEAINNFIETNLGAGAVDVTAEYRDDERLVTKNVMQYLRPTVVQIEEKAHPLFAELPFQYISVLPVANEITEIERALSGSLTVNMFTHDVRKIRHLRQCPTIEKLYIGNQVTCDIDITDPHEGYITDFLYKKKSFRSSIKEYN